MKKTFNPINQLLKAAGLLLVLICVNPQLILAQAQVSCSPGVVALDDNGMATITPEIISALSTDPFVNIEVVDPPLGTNVVTCALAGQTVMVGVFTAGNQCMTTVMIQEKLAPIIDCSPVVIGCNENDTDAPNPPVTDNCTAPADIQLAGMLMPTTLIAGFDGIFAPGNATITAVNPGEDGGFNGAGDELTLVGANAGGTTPANMVCLTGGLDDPACFTATACFDVPVGGTLNFDWTNEPAPLSAGMDESNDPTGYSITNASGTTYGYLSVTALTSGNKSQALAAGDQYCFLIGSNGAGVTSQAVFSNLVYTMDAPDECGVDYLVKSWTATDEAGNSATCKQLIVKEVIPFTDVQFPADIMHPCAVAYATDANGDPAASFTGVPTGCNITYLASNFLTLTPQACGAGPSGCSTIKVEWHVWDNCTGNDSIYNQLITFVDDAGPTITPIDDVTISTDVWTCTASQLLPEPVITDNCSLVLDYEVDASSGDLTYNATIQRWVLSDLAIGTTTVTYTVEDCCGNESTEEFTITVQDLVPPVAVCEIGHTASITVGGTAKVFASTFDDGSHDNCGSVWFKAIRMDDLQNTDHGSNANQSVTVADVANGDDNLLSFGNQIYFDDKVFFDCADIGNADLMVVFRVFDVDPGTGAVAPARMAAGGDLFGHYNDCMVDMQIEDKLAPLVDCPDDVTISCEFWYDMNDLASTFGTVVTNAADRQTHTINDPGNNTVSLIKDGIAYDNCNVNVSEGNPIVNLTCGTGTITRSFTATDDFGKTATCFQTITVQDFNPFLGSDIGFPGDYTTTDCGPNTDPSVTGTPSIANDDVCALISVTYDDEMYTVVPDACLKIKRIWTVTDWCNYDEFDSDVNDVFDSTDDGVIAGQWEAVQFIKVLDGVDPVLANCTDLTRSTDANVCSHAFSFTLDAMDACAGSNLTVDFKIDYDNDGNNVWDDGGLGLTINRTLSIGTHEILWTVEDGCGNIENCTQLVTVEDNETPNIKLIPGNKTVGINNPNDTYELTALHLENGSSDACGQVGNFLIVFPSLGFGGGTPPPSAATSVTLDCGDAGSTPVDIWGQDDAGNWGMASIGFILQYNGGLPCLNNAQASIAGAIESELGDDMEGVMVDIGMDASATNDNGHYEFSNVPLNEDYIVAPEKLDDPRNGLSTLDLVLLSRHLIGLQPLNSPYKLIAADVNGDQQIGTFDIIDLQKVILHIYDDFPNETPAWRFVDASYTFLNEDNPFAYSFPESYYINNLTQDMMTVDFVSIKTGDVNNSAIMNSAQEAAPRTFAGDFPMITERTAEGIVVKAGKSADVAGLQMAIQTNGKSIEHVIPGALALSNTNVQAIANGVYNMVFAAGKSVSVNKGDVLFTLAIDASATLSISDRGLTAEVYSGENLDFLRPTFEAATTNFAANRLYQNQPNPFKQATSIQFELTEATNATLTIYDVAGKVLKVIEGDYVAGMNEVQILAADLSATGVIYYQLSTDNFTATRKMIITN